MTFGLAHFIRRNLGPSWLVSRRPRASSRAWDRDRVEGVVSGACAAVLVLGTTGVIVFAIALIYSWLLA